MFNHQTIQKRENESNEGEDLMMEDVSRKKKTTKKQKRTKGKDGKRKRKACDRWVESEKLLLIKAIDIYGEKNWNQIAKYVGSKNSDQCNQHWHRVLNPKIRKNAWTKQEDEILGRQVKKYGESSWKKIAESLKGRTDIQCRHRWTMLKKFSQKGHKGRPTSRKRKEKNLEIKTVNLNEGGDHNPQEEIKEVVASTPLNETRSTMEALNEECNADNEPFSTRDPIDSLGILDAQYVLEDTLLKPSSSVEEGLINIDADFSVEFCNSDWLKSDTFFAAATLFEECDSPQSENSIVHDTSSEDEFSPTKRRRLSF